ILMMNPLPSLAQAFSILIQEEKQREVKPNNQLHTNFGDNPGYVNFNQQGNRVGSSNYRGGHLGNRPRPFCDHCKRQGHTKERCYKLHGYPQDPRLNKGKRIAANVHGGQRDNVIEGADGSNGAANEQDRTMQALTKEQYNQLVSILENFHTRSGGNELKGGAVNFAGISACSTHFDSGSDSYECSRSIADSWILDSRASNHMIYNKSMLTNIKTLVYPFLVTL
ncbi:hypothetical protein A4A49_56029, partial [Nicotiana attenuata]